MLERDYSQSAAWYLRAAEAGDLDSMCNLATMFYDGQGVGKNLVQALTYFHQAAEMNHPLSQCNLGVIYQDGDPEANIAANEETAVQWYTKAANNNHGDACKELAKIYLNPKSIEQNVDAALELLNRAANNNHSISLRELGYMYASGIHVEKNKDKAIQYYHKAIAIDDTDDYSLLQLGLLLRESGNTKAALELLSRAANNNYSPSLRELGYMYESGIHVEKNTEKAIQYGSIWIPGSYLAD